VEYEIQTTEKGTEMKVVVTSKENDIAVYYCSSIIEFDDGTVSFMSVNGANVEIDRRTAKEIEIISVYFEGGKK
jgi:hypothetical protein